MTTLLFTNKAFLPTTPFKTPINLEGFVNLSQVVSDYNAFYQDPSLPLVTWVNPPPGMPTSMTLSEWQAMGQDLHSLIFDPADPAIAANITYYQQREISAQPPLILPPCCARFVFCTGDLPHEPCTSVSVAAFSQHLAPSIGPVGWSDFVYYDESGSLFQSATFCGGCDQDGLLTPIPASYP